MHSVRSVASVKMDPSQRTTRSTRTRSQKEVQSPLQSLENGTPRRQKRAAPARTNRSKKSNASTATDGADAQTQQPQLDSTTQATTSPSQSPQPESHSEQDVAPESRSTSPPEQQKPIRSMRTLRSRSPQNSGTNGTEEKPKIGGKRGKAVAKAKANSKGPSTQQGVGTSKARGGKRGYTHTAEDEDADAEDAGDERQPAKRNKSHASESQSKKRKWNGVHNHIESSDDDAESAADIRPTKRSRNSTEASSSVTRTPGRQSPSSLLSFRANYQTTVLKPSPANVFASMDANLFNSSPAVGPFPHTGSPIRNQSAIFSSLTASKQEHPISHSADDTPSRKPSNLLSESIQITPAAAAEGSSRKSKSDIFNEDSNPSLSVNDTPSRKLIAQDVSGYQSPRLDASPSNSPQVAPPHTSSHISHDCIVEHSSATKTNGHESNEASSGSTALILASSALAPFTFPVKDRLPPKPTMRNSSALTPSHLLTGRFQESDIETDDDSFSLYKDDDLDVETKERLKAQNAQTCKALKENMQRIKLVKKNFEQKAEEALQEASRTGVLDLSFAASSQPSKKPKSKQTPKPTPLLIFPASDSLERIEVTDPYLIGMLRSIHDYIVADGAQNTIRNASKIVALLEDSTSKHPPKTLLNGQKADDQLENGTISIRDSDYVSGNESDASEDASASYADRADDDTNITSGMGEVTPIPTTPAKAGWLSSLKNAVLTPFSFKGKASTTDIPQAEFTYSHTNPNLEHDSPTRSGRKASSSTRAPRSGRPRRTQPVRVKNPRAKPQQTPIESENGANKSEEFAKMTSKGRAQSRQDRSDEPHDEKHKPHYSTFSVPEYSDDEETEVDVDVTLAASIESEQAAATPATTTATYLPPLQLKLHPGDPVPTIPAGRGYTIKYYDASGKRITHACYNPTGGRLYGFSDDPNDPTYVEDSDPEDEDEDQLTENDNSATNTNTTSQESAPKDTAEFPALAAQQSDKASTSTVVQPAESTSILQPRQWNQTPPPKPRPGNAQLPPPPQQPPQQSPQQPVNKYVPKKPSGLRYVEAMSPIQSKEEGANWEARMHALKEGEMSIEDYLGSFDDELSLWAKEPRIAEAIVMAEMCPPHIMAAVNQAV